MTKEEALDRAIAILFYHKCHLCKSKKAVEELGGIMEVLEKMKAEEEKIDYDISELMHEIYMEGVNMSGEYQGCWVRFKDIEKIMDKYVKGRKG